MSTAPPSSTPGERLAWRILAILVGLAFAWFVVRPLAAPLVLAILTAVIFAPVHQRVARRLASRPVIATFASMSLLGVLLGVPIAGAAALFVIQARAVLLELAGEEEMSSRLGELVRQGLDALARLLAVFGDLDAEALADRALHDAGTALYQRLPDVPGFLGEVGLGFLLVGLVLFFLLRHGNDLVELAVELSPLSETYSRRLLRRLTETIRAIFFGGVVTAVFQGLFGGLAFFVTGFQNFVVWGVLVGAASFVPFVGTALVWGPAGVYLLLGGHPVAATVMLVFGLAISTLDNVLRAFLIHERAAVHPVIVFMALIGGFQSFGPMGLVYGPLLTAVALEMIRIYRRDFASARGVAPPVA